MSKPQINVMLVSITLTAATVCTARACTKRLDETQWPRPETRSTGSRPRYIAPRPRRDPRCIGPRQRRDRDIEDFVRDETYVRLEIISRPRRHHIPDYCPDPF